MRILFLISFIVSVAAGQINAIIKDDFDELIVKGKKLIEEGVQKWDENILMQARAHFERLLQQDKLKWLIHYYMGYADYRLSLYYQSKNNMTLSAKYLDDGIAHLRDSIKLKDDSAESHGLLSSLLGQKIGLEPALGMTLGPESGFELQRAKQLDDKNPRVVFVSAMSAYFTPSEFGGSKSRAIEEMKLAIELFKKEKLVDPRLPDWGHSEALIWLGKFYMDEKKWELAKQNLEEALKIDPQNHFAKLVKSQLEQQMTQNLDTVIIEGKGLLHDGIYQWNEELLLQGQKLFQDALIQKQDNAWLLYYLGLANYWLAIYYHRSTRNIEEVKKYLEEGIKHFEKSIQQNKHNADAYALLASCYGMKISTNPILGIILGPRSNQTFETAVKIDSNNPRIFLLRGIGKYFTPKLFGGGKRKALMDLKKSEELYGQEKIEDPKIPNWGRGELHAWLGKIYMELKEFHKAEEHFQLALTIEPEFYWVKVVLLPQIKELEQRTNGR